MNNDDSAHWLFGGAGGCGGGGGDESGQYRQHHHMAIGKDLLAQEVAELVPSSQLEGLFNTEETAGLRDFFDYLLMPGGEEGGYCADGNALAAGADVNLLAPCFKRTGLDVPTPVPWPVPLETDVLPTLGRLNGSSLGGDLRAAASADTLSRHMLDFPHRFDKNNQIYRRTRLASEPLPDLRPTVAPPPPPSLQSGIGSLSTAKPALLPSLVLSTPSASIDSPISIDPLHVHGLINSVSLASCSGNISDHPPVGSTGVKSALLTSTATNDESLWKTSVVETPVLAPRKKRLKMDELLTEEEKKANHIASEQKRRENIKLGFDALMQLVPSLSQALQQQQEAAHTKDKYTATTAGAKHSRGSVRTSSGMPARGEVLNRAIAFLQRLERRNARLRERVQSLHVQLERRNRSIGE